MSDKFPRDSFTPALILGYLEDEPEKLAATALTSDLEVTPMNVAAMMLCVYQVFEDSIPESTQVDFERETFDIFMEILEDRYKYTSKFNFSDNESDSDEQNWLWLYSIKNN